MRSKQLFTLLEAHLIKTFGFEQGWIEEKMKQTALSLEAYAAPH